MSERSAEFVENQTKSVLERVNPRNKEHVRIAHELDYDSSSILGNEKGVHEELTPEEFRRWIHAGNYPDNMWKQLDFIVNARGSKVGFINSYRSNSHLTSLLHQNGIGGGKKIDEMDWFVKKGNEKFQERAVRQHISQRFNGGTEVMVIWTDHENTVDEIEVLNRLGFKKGPVTPYEGQDFPSQSYYLDQASFIGAAVNQIERIE